MPPRSVPSLISSFKATVTRQINLTSQTPNQPIWQRNYYEHIIRDQTAWTTIDRYIINNPKQWTADRFR
jgi:putative transposase